MVIQQGDVFWADLGPPYGSEPAFHRPVVVVQSDQFNRSGIGTIVVCVLTSNTNRAAVPGNVLLAKGEANLPKPSVVNITQLATLDRSKFTEKIGTISRQRIEQVLSGLCVLLDLSEA